MIERVLILDSETTDLEPEDGRIIECGAILYSVTNRTILTQFSTLLTQPHEGPSHNAQYQMNRIPAPALDEMRGLFLSTNGANGLARRVLGFMADESDIVVAHKVDFDKPWFVQLEFESKKKWVCTREDVPWPHSKPTPALLFLATDYDVPVVWTHRALDDCRLIAEVFAREPNLQELLEIAQEPQFWYIANVPISRNDELKAAGFRWNNQFEKKWSRRMRAADAAALGFPVSKVIEDTDEVLASYGTPRG